ncbi:MAG: 5-oxoprolinase subunit PxpB [Chitinophagaceae bacterium]
MNQSKFPYSVFSLGDAAITIDFGNVIDQTINQEVISRFHQLRENPFPGIIDVVPAYSSLTIHYDILKVRQHYSGTETAFEAVKQLLEANMKQSTQEKSIEKRFIKIPVCYETAYAPDLQQFTEAKNISREELIAIHTQKTYKVFMIGFLPGFAYMGEVDEKIAMSRKQQPNMVAAGSVGIAGKQTGIYPLISPGGWHIIGRTPLKLFDTNRVEPILLRAEDTIQFYSISKTEYENY